MTLLDSKIFMAEKIFTESPYSIPITDKEIRNFIREIPGSPGVYKFLDIFKKPIIELHISNIYKREEFRQKSLISDIVTGGIFGLGSGGYILAIIAMQKLLEK